MQSAPPCPVPAHWWLMQVSGLLLHWQSQLGTDSVEVFVCLFVFLPAMLPSAIPKLPTDSPVGAFPTVWKLLLRGSFPGWVSIPSLFLCCFIFYIWSYLLSKGMSSVSGCLVSSASIQKLFCRSCPTFKWAFDECDGQKVVSPSYSSTILGPPP